MKTSITILFMLCVFNIYAQQEQKHIFFVNHKPIYRLDTSMNIPNVRYTIKFHIPIYDTIQVKLLISEDYNPFSRVIDGYIVTKRSSKYGEHFYNEFVTYLGFNKKPLFKDYIVWDYYQINIKN